MAANIPGDMLPHMDWNVEDKLAAWTFWSSTSSSSTPKEDRVTHILFFGGKEESERWIALEDQLSEEN